MDKRIAAKNLRQLRLMERSLDDYAQGLIELRTLVANLTFLTTHLEAVDPEWIARIDSYAIEFEMIELDNHGERRLSLSTNEYKQINITLETLRTMVNAMIQTMPDVNPYEYP